MDDENGILLDLLLGSKDKESNAILKNSYSAIMGGGDDIIISGVAWKRRSGFGKYSNTVSWI